MNRKALATIGEHSMIDPGDHIIVGVSGGADSVALLHFLAGLASAMNLAITVCHLNHKLRGDESDRDQVFVQQLCDAMGIRCEVKVLYIDEMAKESKKSIEECARDERYRFFEEVANRASRLSSRIEEQEDASDAVTGSVPQASGQGTGAVKIATAHTLSDSVETVLLNLTRGTGLAGLCGIPPVRGRIIRPLIGCTRGEVEAYCATHNLEYVTDSSNLGDDYTRNKLRHRVIPLLEDINAAFEETVGRTTVLLRQDNMLLMSATRNAYDSISASDGSFDRQAYLLLEPSLGCRVLHLLLERENIPRDSRRIAQMEQVIYAGTGGLQLTGGKILRCTTQRFCIESHLELQPFFSHELSLDETGFPIFFEIYPGKRIRLTEIKCKLFDKSAFLSKNQFKNCLDCDKMVGIVTVRQRLEGDLLRLVGRNCTKTIKKMFNESKIPLEERARRLLLSDGQGVLWAEGFGPDQRCAVTEDTRRIMKIEVMEENANEK